MNVAISGLQVGHWTNEEARTGCTVVVLPDGTIASGEVRGGAPATREFALLDPTKTVATVDAVVLSGGSAFGLAAAEGVMAELEAAGRGVSTSYGRVPIVVGMSIFDLGVGDAAVRPGPEEGRLAYQSAVAASEHSGGSGAFGGGLVGVGTGATVDKWSGSPKDGGLGVATVVAESDSADHPVIVTALVAVNAFGAIDNGELPDDPGPPVLPLGTTEPFEQARSNTTIGVVVTNGRATKSQCYLMAQSANSGLARVLLPSHTQMDGDAMVAAATNVVDINIMYLRTLVQSAVSEAVRSVGRPETTSLGR